MTDNKDALKVALVDAIICAYHTTRLSDTPAATHILSKPQVQQAFATLSATPQQDAMREAFVAESVLTISGQCMGHADAVREISRTLDLDASEERIIEEIIGNVVRLERANAKGHLDFAADERDRTIFLARLLGQAREYVTDAIDAMAHSDGSDLLAEIDAALSAPNVAGERPNPYTKFHHVLHAAGLYPTPQPESVEVALLDRAELAWQRFFYPANDCFDNSPAANKHLSVDLELADCMRLVLSAIGRDVRTPEGVIPMCAEHQAAALAEAIEALRAVKRVLAAISENPRGDHEDMLAAAIAIKLIDATLRAQVVAKHGAGR